ncbi:hypothetical protein M0805_006877 [Coniferiporia weirii]|nr:hypothetical protein M0805_006877 [Coniferiporia weirii]
MPGPAPGLAPATALPAAPLAALVVLATTTHTTAALLQPDFIQFVARFYDQPIPSDTRPPSKTIIDRIHHTLDAIPTSQHIRLIGAKWNPSGNLIFSFPTHLSIRLITVILPILHTALRVPLTHPLMISQDVKWAKVILGCIITRDSPTHPLFTDAQLLDGLSVNPHFLTLHLTQLPRWLRRPDSITLDCSSITFAFEDPDGSLLQQFCSCPLFLFGQSACPTPFTDKPCFSQCTKCWKLGHLTATCQNRPMCRACNHFHCANCNGNHPSDSLDCPKQAQYYNCPSAAGPARIGMASPPPALGRTLQPPPQSAPPAPLNVAKNGDRMTCLLNNPSHHILLLQEPFLGFSGLHHSDFNLEGTPIINSPKHPSWTCYLLVADLNSPIKPHILIYVHTSFPGLRCQPRPDLFRHKDILAVDVWFHNFFFRLVNIYNYGLGM